MRFYNQFIFIILTLFLSLGCSASLEEESQNEISLSEIEMNLNQILPQSIKIISVEKTDIEGYLEVRLEGIEPLFISKDGKPCFIYWDLDADGWRMATWAMTIKEDK